jgi:protein disulfide isomerase family A protein 3
MKYLILALCVLSVFADVDESDVIVLTEKNFASEVNNRDLVLVEFYAPWCGHCKKLTPEYAKAATELKKDEIFLGKVDATIESSLASKFGVNGYPTLKIFRNGDHSDYNGPRDHQGIVNYMRKQSGPSSRELKTVADVEAIEKSTEPVVVGFFVSDKSAEYKAFQSVANSNRDKAKFAHTTEANVLDKYGYREAIVLFKPYDDRKQLYTGSVNNNALQSWIYQNYLPLAGVINQGNTEHYDRKGLPIFKVLAAVDVNKNQKQADYYLNRLRKVAKEFPQISFAVGHKRDFSAENEKFGLQGSEQDPFVLTHGAVKYRRTGEKFSVDTVKAFAQDFIDKKLKPYIKSEAVPTQKKGEATVVVGETFNDIVMNPEKDVLIEFYAPWCGHCKSLAPKYDQLAKELEEVESVVIAKFDATANDSPHPEYQARGYPTIFFAPANKKDKPIKYEGDREVAAFKKWLKQNAAKPFELPKQKKNKKA